MNLEVQLRPLALSCRQITITRAAMGLAPLLAPLELEDQEAVEADRLEVLLASGDISLEFARAFHRLPFGY